jgi:hypothetical protein
MVLISKFNNKVRTIDLIVEIDKKETSQETNISVIEAKENSLDKKPKRVKFNIRGIKFDVCLNQFDKFPESRLNKLKILLEKENAAQENLFELCDDFDLPSNELYFNRDPFIFNSILNYYSIGKLHFNGSTCPFLVEDELKYWGLNSFHISTCCEQKFDHKSENIQLHIKKRQKILESTIQKEDFSKCWFPKVQETIWNIMEKPQKSIASKVSRLFFF